MRNRQSHVRVLSTEIIIQEGLRKTNEDIQGFAADWNQIIPEFEGVKRALDIEFVLAKIDPDGNPTNGIVWYPAKGGYGNGSGYDAQIQADAWDNYKYMNIYIQNDLYNNNTTNNSGVSWYPDTWMSDNNLARVVYNGAYIGSNTSENFRSVLTHEFGHWLDLRHTFEGGCKRPNESKCSTTGDMICDTPQVNNSGMGDGASLNCMQQVTNWQNFMDYSDQYAMFTNNQVTRMLNALNHAARFSLWQYNNLVATGIEMGSGDGDGGTALTNNLPISGLSGSRNAETRFYLDIPLGASNLNFTTYGGRGNVDLYVSFKYNTNHCIL